MSSILLGLKISACNGDKAWNPNRIEQRFGRIHRIGQERPCFLWNMVAANTREGEVYSTLLSKIAIMGKTYDGRLGSHKGIQQRCSRCDEHSIRLVWYMAVPRVKCDALIGMRDGLARSLFDIALQDSDHGEDL